MINQTTFPGFNPYPIKRHNVIVKRLKRVKLDWSLEDKNAR